ncbi:BACON domain-containing protein [Usitatibacter palustris]|uniref:Uncharacterized protein n=1 Tax=Usitatibacter palustris TaxID=2732487 RepID=A0A6M4H5W6_9PROT|nr:BACON domain-containing carbohydrate-binding protein [Usitatibacter palustris]QJR15049.1 hypothetical protein DSM104440_01865 [Usitatibacter palustris]
MTLIRRLALVGFFLLPAFAHADSNHSAPVPVAKAAAVESFKLAPGAAHGALRLEPINPALIEEVKAGNAGTFEKRLQIGIGRPVEMSLDRKIPWVAVPGGYAAQWEVSSPGALALRVMIAADREAAQPMQIRFAGTSRRDLVSAPIEASDIPADGTTHWSPVLEGEGAVIEVFAAGDAPPASLPFSIHQVSHFFVAPWAAEAESLAKASGACQIDLICRSATNAALAQVGRAVARMTFGDGTGSGASYLCTGTLLNPTGGVATPYFYGAAHCISTQAAANTLTTHWFYERTSCGSGGVGPNYVQVAGGATLLYANTTSDGLLLQLRGTPPAGAILAGWDSATLTNGTPFTAVHHPAGDFKKVSFGAMDGFGNPRGTGTNYVISRWSESVVEGGSSGSGIFTLAGSEYVLRGGLQGGPSSCTAATSNRYDYYSRFDQVFPAIRQYLNPSACSYSLSPNSITVGANAASGTVAVTSTAGCAWNPTSNQSWLTTSSTGSGSGTLSYSVAANTGATRTATLSIGGVPFDVTQQGTSGTNLVANAGFETGSASWSQSATGGAPLIFELPSQARTGAWVAFLGGYNSGTDTLSQQVTVPSGGTTTLQFWYVIATEETTSTTVYDRMIVSVNNATTGARLATLATYSNLNRATTYAQSAALDLSAFAGQTVVLVFEATMDSSNLTAFFIDDITLTSTGGSGGGSTNYTAMWWNAAESGWGINVSHQGNTVFATMFTYDSAGNPLWLTMSDGQKGSGETFTGRLYRTTGSAFNANPFTPIGAGNITDVGSMTITFSGETATLSYTFNGTTVNKTLTKYLFGSRVANCVSTSGDRTGLTNYQDLWWFGPGESGWGLNITHQDTKLFVTMFNYNAAGQGVWWIMSDGPRQGDGSYLGLLYQTTGPAFNANPFTPIGAGNITQVGTMRLTFQNGTQATLVYTVNGVTVTKQITRYILTTSFPSCS